MIPRPPTIKAERIARALGPAWRSPSGWWNTRCPICQADDKLGLKSDRDHLAIHCFKGCPREQILAEIDRLEITANAGQLPEDPERAHLRRCQDEARRRAKIATAADLWATSVSAYATCQIPTYLIGRNITIAIPDAIRLHGMHGPYGLHRPSGQRRPSMAALVEHVEHGVVAVSQTFLAIEGSSKASFAKPRIFTGPVKGAAVRLGAARPNQWLVVGEGIESTMSVMQAAGYPGWAALSASGIKNLILPPEAQMVLIACDNDENHVGLRAARQAQYRWIAEGRLVKVSLPPLPNTDWNDVLCGRAPGCLGGRRHAA